MLTECLHTRGWVPNADGRISESDFSKPRKKEKRQTSECEEISTVTRCGAENTELSLDTAETVQKTARNEVQAKIETSRDTTPNEHRGEPSTKEPHFVSLRCILKLTKNILDI